MDDLSRFCCLNRDCSDHGKRGHGNLTVPHRSGPNNTRLLRCSTCTSRFSERTGTPLFGSRLSPETVADILAHAAEGPARPLGRSASTATPSPGTCEWPATTPNSGTTSPSLFPPTTTDVPSDETWDFVAKKEKNCEADEVHAGDCWDRVALDPESRSVVRLVVGKRAAEATHELVRDFHRRTSGRIPRLMTSDEYPVSADAIRTAYGRAVTPPRTGKPGRPRSPSRVRPAEVTCATGRKHEENNRAVRVSTAAVFGTLPAVVVALALARVSRAVNASFVERHDGTDRGRCSRKGRKSYEFSKSWTAHGAATRFSYFSDNFCWPVRTLRVKGGDGKWHPRTPAMAAGLTDHVWSIREWIAFPAVRRQ